MKQSLFVNALLKYSIGVVVVGLLIFLPAGTLHFEGGILLMAILFVPMFLAGIVLLKKDPDLLRKRLDVKEKQFVLSRRSCFLSHMRFTVRF